MTPGALSTKPSPTQAEREAVLTIGQGRLLPRGLLAPAVGIDDKQGVPVLFPVRFLSILPQLSFCGVPTFFVVRTRKLLAKAFLWIQTDTRRQQGPNR